MKPQRAASRPVNEADYYWWLLRPWLSVIAVATLAAVTATFLVAQFWLLHYYRATAIIRPVSKSDQGGSLSGMLSGFEGSIGSLAGLSSDEEKDAREYMTILNSYAFTMEVFRHTDLRRRLVERSLTHRLLGWPLSDYRLYEKMDRLLDTDYSVKEGNLTVTFLDPDRTGAEKVLNVYVDLLRERLRRREVNEANLAIDALQKQAASTSDAQLQAALYDYIGKQLERRGMAEVQADFSFKLLEPPIASDRVYSPAVVLDCMVAAVLTPILFTLVLALRERMSIGRYAHVTEFPLAAEVEAEAEPAPLAHRARRQG